MNFKLPKHKVTKKYHSNCEKPQQEILPTKSAQWKISGAMIILCCRIVNVIKNKNIKNSLGAKWNASHLAVRLCALRHWKRVSMPPTTQTLRHPLTRAFHVAPRIKTARRFTAKTPDDNMISWKKAESNLPNDFHGGDAILRVRDK